jgi:hypothetical protein
MHEPTIAGSGLGEGIERAARRWCDELSVQLPFQLPWLSAQRVAGQDFDLARAAFEAKADRADNDLSHSVPRLMRRWADRAATCEGEHCGHGDAKVEGPDAALGQPGLQRRHARRAAKLRRSPCRCCCSTAARTRWWKPPRSRPSATTSTHGRSRSAGPCRPLRGLHPAAPRATRCWWRWTANAARRWRTRWRSFASVGGTAQATVDDAAGDATSVPQVPTLSERWGQRLSKPTQHAGQVAHAAPACAPPWPPTPACCPGCRRCRPAGSGRWA